MEPSVDSTSESEYCLTMVLNKMHLNQEKTTDFMELAHLYEHRKDMKQCIECYLHGIEQLLREYGRMKNKWNSNNRKLRLYRRKSVSQQTGDDDDDDDELYNDRDRNQTLNECNTEIKTYLKNLKYIIQNALLSNSTDKYYYYLYSQYLWIYHRYLQLLKPTNIKHKMNENSKILNDALIFAKIGNSGNDINDNNRFRSDHYDEFYFTLCKKLGKYDECVLMLKNAIFAHPFDGELYYELARFYYYTLKDYGPNCLNNYMNAICLSKPRNRARYYQSFIWYCLKTRKYDKACLAALQLIKLNNTNDNDHIFKILGKIYHYTKRTEFAQLMYEKCITLNPTESNYCSYLYFLYSNLKLFEANKICLDILDEQIVINITNSFYYAYSLLLYWTNDYNKAITFLMKSLYKSNGSRTFEKYLLYFYSHSNDDNDDHKWFKFPPIPLSEENNNDKKDICSDIDEYVASDGGDSLCHSLFGIILCEIGEMKWAQHFVETALIFNNQDFVVVGDNMLVLIYYGKWKKAFDLYTKYAVLVDEYSEYDKVHYMEIMFAHLLSLISMTHDSKNYKIYQNMVLQYLCNNSNDDDDDDDNDDEQKNDDDNVDEIIDVKQFIANKASEIFEKWVSRKNEISDVYNYYIYYYYALHSHYNVKDYIIANKFYDECLKYRPNDALTFYHLSQLHKEMGDKIKASMLLKTAQQCNNKIYVIKQI